MKNKLWLWQLPWVVLFTFAFVVTEAGVQGTLDMEMLRTKVFPYPRAVSNAFTDWKFKIRGVRNPKNKIVVVEIGDDAVADAENGGFGRWPWHRDVIGELIDRIFKTGAKVVGLDIVFSERDQRVSEDFFRFLQAKQLDQYVAAFETDNELKTKIGLYKDHLVLGWAGPVSCQPRYNKPEDCPVMDPKQINIPQEYPKFAFKTLQGSPVFDPMKTPALSTLVFLPNITDYNQVAEHIGYFDIEPDKDGYIRRMPLMHLGMGQAYPALSLEVARVGLNEDLFVHFGEDSKVKRLGFEKSGRALPVNGQGIAEINFRGPGRTFQYISALEFLHNDTLPGEVPKVRDISGMNRKIAGQTVAEVMKDAYVLIGLTALGVYDMRAFPFDSNVPGVEGHATMRANRLANDFMKRGVGGGYSWIWMILLMTVGALGFAYATERLDAVPALLLFIGVFSGIGFIDMKVFFERNINWETSFLYVEIFTIFGFIMTMKYVLEEKGKKVVQANWALYVSPALVESIVKDPSKVSLGSDKKNLTIMFSDVRNFTTFSERMDAKALSSFLSDYLGSMTEIVYETQGTLDKYIGDAIMAFWGAPLDHPKHAAAACQTALKMMKLLEQNRERFLKESGVDVQIGIGINTGNVAVGNMGSKKNRAYTVIGDDVNLASRLEGLTKYYGVHILTTRFTLVEIEASGEPLPRHRVLDFVKVKGKKKAVEMIEVIDRNLPEPAVQLFQEGRELYTQQKWDEAAAKFQAADLAVFELLGEGDGPSREFLQRCADFKKSPPGAAWDGSWEMHSK